MIRRTIDQPQIPHFSTWDDLSLKLGHERWRVTWIPSWNAEPIILNKAFICRNKRPPWYSFCTLFESVLFYSSLKLTAHPSHTNTFTFLHAPCNNNTRVPSAAATSCFVFVHCQCEPIHTYECVLRIINIWVVVGTFHEWELDGGNEDINRQWCHCGEVDKLQLYLNTIQKNAMGGEQEGGFCG